MKKLVYLTLIGAFLFGVQSQEVFSADNKTDKLEAAGTGEAQIAYDSRHDILSFSLRTAGDRERAIAYVAHNGKVVIKEVFVCSGRLQTFEIDMAGMESGAYYVKIFAPSFRESAKFKKK